MFPLRILCAAVLSLVITAPAAACCLTWAQDYDCFCVGDPACKCIPAARRHQGMNCNIFACNCDLCTDVQWGCKGCVPDIAPAADRFDAADANDDDRLSRREVSRWARSNIAAKQLRKLNLRRAFNQMDADRNGYISREEQGCDKRLR